MAKDSRPTLLAAFVSVLLLLGCRAPDGIHSTRQHHVVMLAGIGGWPGSMQRMANMIEKEVPDTSAEVWHWTRIEPTTMFGDLVDLRRNRRRGDVLARQLVEWREDNPKGRISLVANSGGAGIVLFACEALPAEFNIERVVFVSPALSPRVDLAPILRRTRSGVVHYYSRGDWLILGLGTSLFGTTDRKFGPAAGCVGFRSPDDSASAKKIHQIRWEPSMIWLGNFGGHLGGLSPGFVKKHLLPFFIHEAGS